MDALRRVGLAERLHHRPAEMSRWPAATGRHCPGDCRRPPLLLADEPTGNLDTRSGREVMDILWDLHAEGRTIILITHDEGIASSAPKNRAHPGRESVGGHRYARRVTFFCLPFSARGTIFDVKIIVYTSPFLHLSIPQGLHFDTVWRQNRARPFRRRLPPVNSRAQRRSLPYVQYFRQAPLYRAGAPDPDLATGGGATSSRYGRA